MIEKVKVLSINTKKKAKRRLKKPKDSLPMQEYIEQLAPDMYSVREVYVEGAIEAVEAFRPEIIWILQEVSKDYSELVKEIKRIHPAAVVFMLFFGVCEDEEEMMNTYSVLGVYKCYFLPPMILDTLVHDMYVATNLE